MNRNLNLKKLFSNFKNFYVFRNYKNETLVKVIDNIETKEETRNHSHQNIRNRNDKLTSKFKFSSNLNLQSYLLFKQTSISFNQYTTLIHVFSFVKRIPEILYAKKATEINQCSPMSCWYNFFKITIVI